MGVRTAVSALTSRGPKGVDDRRFVEATGGEAAWTAVKTIQMDMEVVIESPQGLMLLAGGCEGVSMPEK